MEVGQRLGLSERLCHTREIHRQYSIGEPEDPLEIWPVARVAAYRGELGRARELAQRSRDLEQHRPTVRAGQEGVLGLVDAWSGDEVAAVAHYATAEQARHGADVREPNMYRWRADFVLHEFLPQIVGQSMVDDVLRRGRRFYRAKRGEAFIPVEFQTGTYRMGHSMVRPSYRANLAGDGGRPFFGFIFDPSQEGKTDPDDFRGGTRAPRRFVGWQTFFDFGDGEVKPNKKIDTKISTALFHLPLGAIASHDAPTALPQRNLLRHLTWALPSGQRVARAIGVTPLHPVDLDELAPLGVGFQHSTPLWYYVLKEAEVVADGLHLGPVGGRIAAEVFIGLLETDPRSYLAVQPRWQPTLPSRNGAFRMTDFLTFAGVDPQTRGQ
jgi:hypothetical protein